METRDIILISGIVLACIWMVACVLLKGKGRRYIIIAGIVIDVILFVISRNCDFLLVGVLGGLACGLIPFLTSKRKYHMAVKEMHGVKNWTGVSVIFVVMVFLVIALACPGMEIVWA